MQPQTATRTKGPVAKARARKKRKDAAVAKKVRELVAERDGHCRYSLCFHGVGCYGPSQWAHFADFKRFKTRGMEPEERHTTGGTLMLCLRHHELYDKGHLRITAMTDRLCDGELEFKQ